MGEVYRARDTRLERDVAIKVLPNAFAPGSRQLAQFEAEARLLASLQHPNICAIYDVGADRGVTFIVMEQLLGETLSSRIGRGPIDVKVALRYAIQIADALRAAHSAGLVHRDVKPGNIMLTTTGVKLLDFGLAKRHAIVAPSAPRGATADSVAATESVDVASQKSGVVGTLPYMAPEQLAGGVVDARVDIWAFGCVLYEMVTGKRAFSGKTLSDVIAAIVTEKPLVMTIERDVVPLALEHVVARCLARNPEERWQSAAEVAQELMSMIPHTASGSLPPAVTAEVMAQTQKKEEPKPFLTKARIAVAASVLVVAAAGAAWAWFRNSPGPLQADSVAVLPFVNTGGKADEAYLGEGLSDGVVAELKLIPQAHVAVGRATLRARSSSDPREAARALGATRVVSGRLQVQGDRLDVEAEILDVTTGSTLWSGHYSEPLTGLVPLQRELAGGVVKALRLESNVLSMPAGLNSETYRLILKGRHAASLQTESALKSAVGFFTEASAKDPAVAAAHAGLAQAHIASVLLPDGAVKPAEALPKAKKAAARALELDSQLADAHAALAFARMFDDWDWQGAGAEFDRAVASPSSDPVARQWRANWFMSTGRTDDALAEAKKAAGLDPQSLSASLDHGWQLYLAHRYSESTAQLQRTIKLRPDAATAHCALGWAYEKSGRLDEALRELQTATTTSGGKAFCLAGLGYTSARAGRPAEAKQILERLRATAAREYVSPFDIALVAVGLDDKETAFKALGQAVDDHATGIASLAVDPRLDPLRSDPRFRDLLKRVGL